MKIESREEVENAYRELLKDVNPSIRVLIGELIDEAMNWQERLDSCNNDPNPESKLRNERAAQAQANVNLCRSIATGLKQSI